MTDSTTTTRPGPVAGPPREDGPRRRPLPPGQRVIDWFPRFGTHSGRAAPSVPADAVVDIGGVVAEMDRTMAELVAAPEGREPLRVVLRRMRPVRGVAGMETLAPA